MIKHASTSRMPDVTGLNWKDASRILAENRFHTVKTVVQESKGGWDLVLSQDPAPDVQTDHAGPVTLTVSGPDLGRHLPATLTESDSTGFLRNFLRIFAHAHLETDRDLCLLQNVFSIHRCPDDYLRIPGQMLATIYNLPDLSTAPRHVLAAFCILRKENGTPESIRRAVKLMTGIEAEIVENSLPFNEFRVGVSTVIGADCRVCERVLKTTVFTVNLNCRPDAEVIQTIHRTVNSIKPAGTFYALAFPDTSNTQTQQHNPARTGFTRSGISRQTSAEAGMSCHGKSIQEE
jgi:phage tail-like protein